MVEEIYYKQDYDKSRLICEYRGFEIVRRNFYHTTEISIRGYQASYTSVEVAKRVIDTYIKRAKKVG